MGIPREAETVMLERDIRLVRLTGARYHAAMISCADSVAIVRRAKEDGLPVTCGVSVNNLVLNENDIGHYRTFCRLSPPLRHEVDRHAVVQALADGVIDVIVSDHNPQDVRDQAPAVRGSRRRRAGHRDPARCEPAPRPRRRHRPAETHRRADREPGKDPRAGGGPARRRGAGRPRPDRSRSALRPRQAPAEVAIEELALRRGPACRAPRC